MEGIPNKVPNKCIVFILPRNHAAMVAGMFYSSKLRIFSENNNIKYYTKTADYKIKVWFEDEKWITLFLLTHNFSKNFHNLYIMVEDYIK